MRSNGLAIHNLASGSSANSLLVRTGGVTLLVDSGLPIRKLQSTLISLDMTIDDIDMVFITHEHSDHVRSLPQLMRRGTMVMTTRGTGRALRLADADFVPMLSGRRHDLAGMSITPLSVSHDAAEPVGLCLEVGDQVIVVMTDLGQVEDHQFESLSAADLIILEANHDLDMLRLGPYPSHLKRRVMSGVGHLSNAECGKALRRALGQSTKNPQIWLAHLSETNNKPVTAATTVRQHIPGARLAVLPRHEVVDLVEPVTAVSVRPLPAQQSLWTDQS